MSALRGFPGLATGRITVNSGAASNFFRAMGVIANPIHVLKSVAAPGTPPFFFNGSVNVQADGAVLIDAAGAITQWTSGLPLTAAGALAVEVAVPATYSQGIGITAAGRVAIN